MAYHYKSALLPFLLSKGISFCIVTITGGFLFNGIWSIWKTKDIDLEMLWVAVPLSAIFVLFGIVLIRLKRVEITPEGIALCGLFGQRTIPYAQVLWAAQVYLFAPKMIIVRTTRRFPFSFILYQASYFIGDFFNLNAHESVEYINFRATAAG